jgi:hypothetical protein
MVINILIAIIMRLELLYAILTRKVLFLNKQEFVLNTQNLL